MRAVPLATAAALLLGATGLGLAQRAPAAGQDAAPQRATQDTGRVRLRLAPAGNEVRYRVNEQLAGRTLRNDAVGVTTMVSGQLVLGAAGSVRGGQLADHDRPGQPED